MIQEKKAELVLSPYFATSQHITILYGPYYFGKTSPIVVEEAK
jgi:hypothetical protein